ncbi:MAG: PA14 domain-containing protein, partial [Aggregatilineales bacterium]
MRRTYLPAILLTTIGIILLLGVSFYGAIPTVYAQVTGTDWIGQFYNNTTLSGSPVNTGLFPAGLNTNWGLNAPTDGSGTTIAGMNIDNWSARFTSTENIAAGLYEFVLVADDGARLYIDGNLVIDNFDSTGLTQASVVLSLSGGVYTIIVDYRDVADAAVLQLSWFTSEPTPEFTATPVPLAEAQVDSTRVRGLALRTGPYLGASLINVLRPDKVYPITAQNFSEGIYTWYRITVPSTGQVGWASGRYLTITGTSAVTGTCPITAEFALE